MKFFALLAACCSLATTLVAEESFDSKAETFMKTLNLPGLAVATISISDEGKVSTWEGTYGYAELETRRPVSQDTAFWLGSVSKTFVGFAVAKAIDQGLICLDDDVNEILARESSSFQVNHPYRDKVLVKDLVTHSSGIVDNEKVWNAFVIAGEDGDIGSLYNLYHPEKPLKEFDELKNRNLLNLRGHLFSYLNSQGLLYSTDNFSKKAPLYSNIGTDLAAYLVSVVAQKPLEDYLAETLLAPLHLQSTFMNWPPEIPNEKFAVQYLTKGQVQAIPQYNLTTWPDGGIRSSVRDLSHYLAHIMLEYWNSEESNSSLLSKESLNLMLNPQYSLSEDEQIGIFWQTQKVKLKGVNRELIGHDGSDPGAFTFLLFDPNEKLGIILLANGQEGNDPDLLLDFIGELFEKAKGADY